MTWFALFASWKFWLAVSIISSLTYWLGFATLALFAINKPDPVEAPPCDLSLELTNLRQENQRLTEANFALNMQNAALERELNALDPGYSDEPEQRLDETPDRRRT